MGKELTSQSIFVVEVGAEYNSADDIISSIGVLVLFL